MRGAVSTLRASGCSISTTRSTVRPAISSPRSIIAWVLHRQVSRRAAASTRAICRSATTTTTARRLRGSSAAQDRSGRFLEFVHDIDLAPSSAAPEWPPLWRSCPAAASSSPTVRAAMPSGSQRNWACCDLMEDICDIAACEFVAKPSATAFKRMIDRHGVAPSRRRCSRTCRTISKPRTRSA